MAGLQQLDDVQLEVGDVVVEEFAQTFDAVVLVLSGYQHGLCDIDGVCLLSNVNSEGARFCQENMKRIAAGVAFAATTTRDMICGEMAAGGQDGPLGAILSAAGQRIGLAAVRGA